MFEDEILMATDYVINIFDSEPELTNNRRRATPHSDPSAVVLLVYLNKDDEECYGTGFYKHKHIENYSCKPAIDFHVEWLKQYDNFERIDYARKDAEFNKFYNDKDIFPMEGNENWELTLKSEGKYNQAVIYIGAMFHSPLMNDETLKGKDFKRINNVLFLQKMNKRMFE